MLTKEIIATREKTLAAHLDGESRKDADAVLATFGGEPTYDLVSIQKKVIGKEPVRKFLQTLYDSLGPNTHLAEAFFHAEGGTTVEVLTIFHDGLLGEEKGSRLEVRTVGIFTFDGDKLLVEKLYADMAPLTPYLDFLD